MSSKVALFTLLVVTITICRAQDISFLLRDQALVRRQIDCAMDRRPCDVIGRQVKALIPEALLNNCRRCTRVQAKQAQQVIEFMQENYPQEFNAIIKHNLRL